MIINRKFFFTLTLLLSLTSYASEEPGNFLKLLPLDLWREVINYSMSPEPLWRDENTNTIDHTNVSISDLPRIVAQIQIAESQSKDTEITRVDTALSISLLAQELCKYNLQNNIINRMRKDLATAKDELLDPFYSKDPLFYLSFAGGMRIGKPAKFPAWSPENPKMFQKLLPIKNILSYCEIDKEWLKNFLATKQCGGTLRKHIFIAAMQHQHEYLVNFLWNSCYRTKIMKDKTRNRSFIRMAQCSAKRAGYEGIHEELKKAYDKLTAEIKASRRFYPGHDPTL